TVSAEVNPCKRQPFRGRCPSVKGKIQPRSQFVLRYYLRDSECVSYPFGHCADDEDEPKLFRYKEECEQACIGKKAKTADTSATVSRKLTTTATTNDDSSSSSSKSVTEENDSGVKSPNSNGSTSSPYRTTSTTPRRPLTECQRRRQTSESSFGKTGYIPICAADGSFRPLQCELPPSEQCFCVDRNGLEIPHSRTNHTKKPDCSR
ncbi:unnamed protein product, partial [Gongylonema pulchrum]|uniref:Thyroglobulin type-1 domain-containing protein n=1 Tax=Gongylonema pulchrum TaxID=637853 RepID=A0A183CZG1_9BILA